MGCSGYTNASGYDEVNCDRLARDSRRDCNDIEWEIIYNLGLGMGVARSSFEGPSDRCTGERGHVLAFYECFRLGPGTQRFESVMPE